MTEINEISADSEKVTERLSELDKMTLELAKSNKKVALAQAEKAIAQNETADLAYKYVVLQIYMKYKLSEMDAIGEGGEIIRNGAKVLQDK
jgi:hypothetical protein